LRRHSRVTILSGSTIKYEAPVLGATSGAGNITTLEISTTVLRDRPLVFRLLSCTLQPVYKVKLLGAHRSQTIGERHGLVTHMETIRMINTGLSKAYSTIGVDVINPRNKMSHLYLKLVGSHSGSLCRLGLSFVALMTVILLGCGSPDSREIGRYVSPDKLVDAVLVEFDTGAMVARPTKLFLVPGGKDWHADSPIVQGDKFEELRIVWQRSNLLEIHYKKGRIFSFASFWASKDVLDFRHMIELRLVPETDSTLPDQYPNSDQKKN